MATPLFKIDLTPIMGTVFIGTLISAVFMGITTMQTIFYYSTYPDDKLILKILVAVIWILDAFSLVLFGHGLYVYLITNFTNPLILLSPTWSLILEHLPTACVALLVHLFLIYRIYSLNKKLTPFAVAMILLSLFTFSMALISVIKGMLDLSSWTASEEKWVFVSAEVTTAFIDVVLAVVICWQLRQAHTGFKKTSRMINVLSAYTLSSGALTSVISLAVLSLYLASPNTLLLMAFYPYSSKAYANALLASLNCRQVIRGTGIDSTVMFADQQWRSSILARNAAPSTTVEIHNIPNDCEKATDMVSKSDDIAMTSTTSSSSHEDDLYFAGADTTNQAGLASNGAYQV